MPTRVEYTDQRPAVDEYPLRIVSPPRPSSCCASCMTFVSEEIHDGPAVFRYKRCSCCGYTVRHILRKVLDASLTETLRRDLAVAFSRLDYDLSGVVARGWDN